MNASDTSNQWKRIHNGNVVNNNLSLNWFRQWRVKQTNKRMKSSIAQNSRENYVSAMCIFPFDFSLVRKSICCMSHQQHLANAQSPEKRNLSNGFASHRGRLNDTKYVYFDDNNLLMCGAARWPMKRFAQNCETSHADFWCCLLCGNACTVRCRLHLSISLHYCEDVSLRKNTTNYHL